MGGVICGVSLLIGIGVYVLREFGWRAAPILGALGGVLLLSFEAEKLTRIGTLWQKIATMTDASASVTAMGKVFCIGYLCSLTCRILEDLDAQGIARALAVCARIEILLITLPFIERILEGAVALVF